MGTTKSPKTAYSWIATAAVLWGMIGVFYRRLAAEGFSPMQIVAVRVGTAAAVLIFYLSIVSPDMLKIRLKDSLWFVGMGMGSLVLFNWCYFRAIEETSLAAAAVMLYTAPVFVLFLSVWYFGERLTVRKCCAALVTLGGSALVSGIVGNQVEMPVAGLIYGLGSGLGYGMYSIIGVVLLKKYEPETVSVYSFLFAAVGALILAGFRRTQIEALAQPSVLVAILGIGIFCSMLPFTIYTKGLKYVPASRAAVFAALEPAVAALTGLICFGEQLGAAKIGGIVLILIGIMLLKKH